MKYLLTLLLIPFTFQHTISAQESARFQIRHYTTENGLPSNGLKGIQWDKETKFLWIATQAGVVRFNGIDFKIYNNQNTSFIGSERIWELIKTRKGEMLVIDDKQNIIQVNKNKLFLHYKVEQPGFSEPYFGLLISDSFYYEKKKHPISGPQPDVYVRHIVPVTDTSLVFVSDGKLFTTSLGSDKVLPFGNSNKLFKTGFRLNDKLFLVSSENKIFIGDIVNQELLPVPFEFPEEKGNSELQFFWETGMENPVVINKNKAWLLDYDGKSIKATAICDAIPENFKFVRVQYSIENKILFLASDSKGLVMISENRVEVMKANAIANDAVTAYYSQIELPGNAVFASEGHVISKSKGIANSLPVKTKFYFNSYTTGDSLLWYIQDIDRSKKQFLHSYNYKTGETIFYRKIPIVERFGLTCSSGKVYIVSDQGFAVLDKDSLSYLFPTPKETIQNYAVFGMVELAPGEFCVPTCNGLVRYNVNINKVDTLLKLPGYCIRTVWKYKDYLFIGTYGKGYYIYKDGKMKAMPLDKNRYLSHVHCFIPDKYGYCWMSTNRGLLKSNLADLLNAFEKGDEKIYYHYFGRNDGMDNTEMNGGCTPCALQMRSGTISFPTMDGLLWVDPETSRPILPTGDVFIDELYADNRKIDVKAPADLDIPANVNALTVYLGYPAWCNKENLYIEYDLNNSGVWRTVDLMNNAVIHLFGLGPGKYDLRIRKMKGFGANNYSYDELQFSVKTPWYFQWWFLLVVAAVAFGIIRLIVRLRIKQYRIRQEKLEKLVAEKTSELQHKTEILEKNDTIKTRLISIISHDIVTPLKFLSVAGKNLVEKRQMMSEELQNETIGEMTNTSQELQLLTTNILNWIKYQNENRRLVKENFHVHELVNHVFGVLNSMAHQKGLKLSNNVDESLEIFQFAEPTRILIYNLVSNAINFSEGGNIIISSVQEPGSVTISVKDEGVGMAPDQVSNIMAEQIIIKARKTDTRQGNGLGYLIIKDLVKMIGAELKIESEMGKGTLVSIIIPDGKENFVAIGT